MRPIAVAALLAVLPVLAACNSMEPPYPAAAVVFDETLLGVWQTPPPKAGEREEEARFTVTERRVDVFNGRLNPELSASDTEQARAYEVTSPTRDRRGDYKFHAYLVRAGESTFLGVQTDPAELERIAPSALVLPLHILMRIERDGDTVTLNLPNAPLVAWVPLASGWLDTDPAKEPVVSGPSGERSTIILTNSIDRVLEVCRERAARPDLWSEEPMVLHRVKDEADVTAEQR